MAHDPTRDYATLRVMHPLWLDRLGIRVPDLPPPWDDVAFLAVVALATWGVRRLSWPLAHRLVRLSRFARRARDVRPERRTTLQGLVADLITTAVLIGAVGLGIQRLLGVSTETLLWTIGLFSAAFGFGARPMISDYLAGIGFVFEDTFSVGEKVFFKVSDLPVEGVIEAVNLRTTLVRAPTGELCVVPNGEIRALRNFSRGRFSPANVTLTLRSTELARALPILEDLGREAADTLPELIEPWQIISESGVLGHETTLTLVAKARFGTGADLRPRLLALIHQRLGAEGLMAVE